MGKGMDAILRLAETRHLDIVAMFDDDAPELSDEEVTRLSAFHRAAARRPRDLDYGDVEADADRMQAVLDMRAAGHTDACIDNGSPGNEPTPGCAGCARVPAREGRTLASERGDLVLWQATDGPGWRPAELFRYAIDTATGVITLTPIDTRDSWVDGVAALEWQVRNDCPHGRTLNTCEWCAPSMWRDGGPL